MEKGQEQSNLADGDMLDSFDHVVVLMFENRSFDNILGYLYPDGVPDNAPAGKSFNGVAGKDISNPVPADAVNKPSSGEMKVSVSPTSDYHQPYPDPVEDYPHVNTQLFNTIDGRNKSPYNLPNPVPSQPAMQGFVKDYIENYKTTECPNIDPTYDEYKAIMQCFDTSAIPVITTLAEQFAVFDHWFCSVPSQTWCNRAFWNAATSWGHVVNGGAELERTLSWIDDSIGNTIFNQLEDSGFDSPLNWKVYSSNVASLTGIIHLRALEDYHLTHFPSLNSFFEDCANGDLPSYSFIEPNFWTPHNDMHPSTFDSKHYGLDKVGSVLLGEHLLWQVYSAIKSSSSKTGNNWENTLLIITFDEHGGCFDHVAPPPKVTPPDLSDYTKWEGFDFARLGVRVPTIMVSAHIDRNTVINTPMAHDSFLKTMQTKWNKVCPGKFPTLTARQKDALEFTEVFTSKTTRDILDWPEIKEPVIPEDETDYSDEPLNDLHKSMLYTLVEREKLPDAENIIQKIKTQKDAINLIQTFRRK